MIFTSTTAGELDPPKQSFRSEPSTSNERGRDRWEERLLRQWDYNMRYWCDGRNTSEMEILNDHKTE